LQGHVDEAMSQQLATLHGRMEEEHTTVSRSLVLVHTELQECVQEERSIAEVRSICVASQLGTSS
jgi:hypothetical protein